MIGRLLLVMMLALGCIDTLDIDLPNDRADRLVVEGFVERGEHDYVFFASVSTTQPVSEAPAITRLPATINILANGSPTLEIINGVPTQIGIDEYHQQFGIVQETVQFRLRVNVRGKVFESTDQAIIPSPAEGHLSFTRTIRNELNEIENIVQRPYIQLRVNAPLVNDEGAKVSMRWDVSGVYQFVEIAWTDNPFFQTKSCFVYDRLTNSQFSVLQGDEVSGDMVEGFMIDELFLDSRFYIGYYYTVLQRTLSDQAADYWNQIVLSGSREGSIFDVPAGRLNSNIRVVDGEQEDVVGYFYGTAVDTLRMLVRGTDVDQPRSPCPQEDSGDTSSDPCCNCLLLHNSTTMRPHFWKL
jgi:hypothetical protein